MNWHVQEGRRKLKPAEIPETEGPVGRTFHRTLLASPSCLASKARLNISNFLLAVSISLQSSNPVQSPPDRVLGPSSLKYWGDWVVCSGYVP